MKNYQSFLISSRAAALKGKPLKLGQSAALVITISSLALLYAVWGIRDISAGRKHHALFQCGIAVFILMTLPIHVYNFLRVKKGAKVLVANPLPLLEMLHVPLSIKVTLVGSLTVLVSVVSWSSLAPFYFVPHVHLAQRFMLVNIGFNLFLWVVVAFAWYLFVILHQQETLMTKAIPKQGNDVWPLAPRVAVEEDNNE